jgi:hypothetical protein
VRSINDCPPALSRGLGVWSDKGRIRSPRPAAKIMARMVKCIRGLIKNNIKRPLQTPFLKSLIFKNQLRET